MFHIGGALHPGPGVSDDRGDFLTVEFVIIGGWFSNGDLALDSGAQFLAVADHWFIPAGARSNGLVFSCKHGCATVQCCAGAIGRSLRNWSAPKKKADAKVRQQAGKFRRDSQVGGHHVAGAQCGPPPEGVLSNARARVTKLEEAMAAVGECDPYVRRVTRRFEERKGTGPSASRRRRDRVVESVHRTCQEEEGREEVSRAQEVLSAAQAKVQSEEHGLADAEARLAARLLEESSEEAAPPPTSPADFPQELAELRACV